jgi:hypothetical protein
MWHVTAGQVISAADIAAGRLSLPALNGNGFELQRLHVQRAGFGWQL